MNIFAYFLAITALLPTDTSFTTMQKSIGFYILFFEHIHASLCAVLTRPKSTTKISQIASLTKTKQIALVFSYNGISNGLVYRVDLGHIGLARGPRNSISERERRRAGRGRTDGRTHGRMPGQRPTPLQHAQEKNTPFGAHPPSPRYSLAKAFKWSLY